MTDQPTPTPRTDLHSVHWVQHGGSQSTEVVPAYFARELERELDFSEKSGRQIWSANERLKRELDEAREQIAANHKATELIERMLYAERELADRLAKSINRLSPWLGESSVIAQALAAWKEARRE